MLGVPNELFGDGMLGVEMKVAVKPIVALFDLPHRADAILISPRRIGATRGMIHIDAGPFVKRNRFVIESSAFGPVKKWRINNPQFSQ